MELQVIAIFCICDDFIEQQRIMDDRQTVMTTAEVMTAVLVSAFFFSGDWERARSYLEAHRYFRKLLSKSRLNRRIHKISPDIWTIFFDYLATHSKQCFEMDEFAVDSFPVSVCQNSRISRCRIYRHPSYRGYCASKHSYFYGIKVHMIVTRDGHPVEMLFSPGSHSDITVFRYFRLDFPCSAKIYGDRAYTDYQYEDLLMEAAGIQLVAQRRDNSRRPLLGPLKYLQSVRRKCVETTFSQITRLFPRYIHAVTARGFELKVLSFILAFCLQRFL